MSAIEMVIDGRRRSLGGSMEVLRVLPHARRRHVGPVVFLDQMGPTVLEPGEAADVRPHPHIALATVTYLYEGEIIHRDSLGIVQAIRPGEVNWMTAGRGIVHSERGDPGARQTRRRLHGLQLWVALPAEAEESEPEFHHHPAGALPELVTEAGSLRLIAGEAYGLRSPVKTYSKLFYLSGTLGGGVPIEMPDDHPERALYVVEGAVEHEGQRFEAGQMLVFRESTRAAVSAPERAVIAMLGGASVGERFIEWNFVSSSKERIERAKADWRARRFPTIPGDDAELIPLPE